MRPIYECDSCLGFINFDTNSYFKNSTYRGSCTQCYKEFIGSCVEVNDAYNMRGAYKLGSQLYRSFE